MALEILHYEAYLGTVEDPKRYDVDVLWADQCLAEREAPRHGITRDIPLNFTNYLVWLALKRTGQLDGLEFQPFLQQLVGITPPEKGTGKQVDPTPANRSVDWPSPYPLPSEAPSTSG